MENPFTIEYWKTCVEQYGSPSYKKDGLEIVYKTLSGRVDDYFNKNFHSEPDPPFPILTLDNHLWMSITPMECQSGYLPKHSAKGKVGTAGLGMGTFALDCMASEAVQELHIWEIDPRVIEYFTSTFKDRAGFDKLSFYQGDAREFLKNQTLDFLYVDIYDALFNYEAVLDDIAIFQQENHISVYHWCGQEIVLLSGLMSRLRPALNDLEREYFHMWLNTTINGLPLSGLYQDRCDPEFTEECLISMGRL